MMKTLDTTKTGVILVQGFFLRSRYQKVFIRNEEGFEFEEVPVTDIEERLHIKKISDTLATFEYKAIYIPRNQELTVGDIFTRLNSEDSLMTAISLTEKNLSISIKTISDNFAFQLNENLKLTEKPYLAENGEITQPEYVFDLLKENTGIVDKIKGIFNKKTEINFKYENGYWNFVEETKMAYRNRSDAMFCNVAQIDGEPEKRSMASYFMLTDEEKTKVNEIMKEFKEKIKALGLEVYYDTSYYALSFVKNTPMPEGYGRGVGYAPDLEANGNTNVTAIPQYAYYTATGELGISDIDDENCVQYWKTPTLTKEKS